jgi:Serine dehydrogenase proteinase
VSASTIDKGADGATGTSRPGPAIPPVPGQPSSPEYIASIYPGPGVPIPVPFAEAVLALGHSLERPVWVLSHGFTPGDPIQIIDDSVSRGFFDERQQLKACENGAVLVIDSPGGLAGSTYQIAKLFMRHCDGFTVVVPRMAKSAATLLTLAADTIYLGMDAQLGPLDAQIWDNDREAYTSALDEVQALERLNSVALNFVDQAMFLLTGRTGKKMMELLPLVLDFAAAFVHPLLDKIDTVHYNERARVLKIAEEYAIRLLGPHYAAPIADEIARRLVHAYPEHAFVIDQDEARGLLEATIVGADPTTQERIDALETILTQSPITAIGRVERNAGMNGEKNETQ